MPNYELKAVCTSHEDTAKASAAAFGAERGFHRFSDMAAHPDVDLIVVCVRVPGHRELVMAGLQAGKPVFCEWPLGANLAEAEEMAGLARQRSLPTIVGLQARSDPAILYARDLIQQGYIGEVLTANLNTVAQAQLQRGPGRIWQGVRANGANTLTIAGGHAIDALCAVLGEFAELSARVSTRIPEWRTLEGKPVPGRCARQHQHCRPHGERRRGVDQRGRRSLESERQPTGDLRARGRAGHPREWRAQPRTEPDARGPGQGADGADGGAGQVPVRSGGHSGRPARTTSPRRMRAPPTRSVAAGRSTSTSISPSSATS